ncbi:MAG: metallophosphoesterase family protein [Planctomycetes bacterium]|nr:metallophosphoesterase family protein [Planctomycetota bacterium]
MTSVRRLLPLLAALLAPLHASLLAQTVTRGPYLQSAGPDRITVCWRTDVACDSRVAFGLAPGALSSRVDDPAAVIDHAVTLTGLSANTRLWYSIGTSSAVLAGDDPAHTFLTAPPAGRARAGRFWVLGDSGTKDANARAVRDAFYARNGGRPLDAFLMLGDNAYDSGKDSEYQDAVFSNMYEARLIDTVLWPAYGNHDALSADSSAQSGVYYDLFALPKAGECGGVPSGTEAYWSFDWGNAHFVCLDSMESDRLLAGPMLSWLALDLQSTAAEWLIAFWHHPPYSKGSHDSDSATELVEMRQNAVDLLEQHGVDLVLCGHSHSYERTFLIDGHRGKAASFDPLLHGKDLGDGELGSDGAYRKPSATIAPHEGAVYVVAGASGKHAPGSFDHPAMQVALEKLGSFVFELHGVQLDAWYLDSTGALQDRFTLVKGGATPIDGSDVVVLPLGAAWRYADGGSLPAPDWASATFDDSGWASGPAPLGYGESYVATPVSWGNDPNLKHVTTWLRASFDLAADPRDLTSLRLRANYDDGFVVYVNGVEAARRSLPAGAIDETTLATSHEGGALETIDLAPALAVLQRGSNTLAIEIHQTSRNSSDLVFDGQLEFDGFTPLLPQGAEGALDPIGGVPLDVLRVNGSTGGLGRGVDVADGAAITVELDAPPGRATANFALFGWFDVPGPDDGVALGSIGTLVVPPLFWFAHTFPFGPPPLLPSYAAPWSYTEPAVDAPLDIALQAVIQDAQGALKTTNAVLIRVR